MAVGIVLICNKVNKIRLFFSRPKHSLLRDECGATAIIIACMFSLLLAVMGALVDTARLTLAQNKLQSALDAAALAAVRDANTLNLQQEVTKFFNANFPSNYMGMGTISASDIVVTQNGNEYTFTVSRTLSNSIMSGSNNISVQARITTGSSSGTPAEIALILDNSAAMALPVAGGLLTRLALMQSAVGNLMDRIQNGNNKISLINFNDSVRVAPSVSSSWLQTTPSPSLPGFSSQSTTNYGRFDGCLSTKYAESNSAYPSSNSNNYLSNNDNAPSSGKFRQYVGPVDINYYYQGTTFYNYSYTYDYTYDYNYYGTPYSYSSHSDYSYGYNYVTGASVYSTTATQASIPPFFYGNIQMRDTLTQNSGYTQTLTYNTIPYTYQSTYSLPFTYDYSNGFNFYSAEYSAHTPTGSAAAYDYLSLHPSMNQYPYAYYYSYDYRSSSYDYTFDYAITPNMVRKIDFGHSYVYALKAYFGYRPPSSGQMTWKAYDAAGGLITTGSARLSAASGTAANNESYVGEIFLPVPFRPFASVEITYPALPKNSACTADFYYCYEYHKAGPNQYCTGGSCTSFSVDLSSYHSYDYFVGYALTGPISAYPTCGALAESQFMQSSAANIKTAVNNLVVGGPARVNIGLNWGWRALAPKWLGLFNSSQASYPLPYNNGNTKTAVLITQGDSFRNRAQTPNNSDGTYFDDVSFSALCTNIKATGIKLYVIGVGVTNPTTITRLTNCASSAGDYANITSVSSYATIIGRIADGVSTGPSGSIQFH
jgi:Flp pilus assembly protein TadG